MLKVINQQKKTLKCQFIAMLAALLTVLSIPAIGASDPGGYGLKIYKVNSGLYPYVQIYFRTFDQNQQPLVNLNAMNVGLMVKGKAYDPAKRQYQINSIRQRQEATRSVLILDASKSMVGAPFGAALRASARYIDSKRPQDEVAILSIRDTKTGYDVVSEFERDPGALGRRLADVKADGNKSRIYDSIGAAMQMCGMAAQGSVTPSAENYIVSCSIVVFSDGFDDGSALSREELNGRITALNIPIPVYSLAYTKQSKHFKNLESLSKNSFGIYYLIGEAADRMQQTVEQIQNIIQSDYVLTFRSVVPVDGEEHAIKVGVEYPSGSGKFTYENAKMEAIEPPPIPVIMQMIQQLNQAIPPLPAGQTSPYFDRPAEAASAPKATTTAQ
ncbi:MAG: VWA domain-containing protein [Methylobacter sp.]|uniref:VWA domain-containing protein n=1 Tax=Candidatus Methylobacter titanis TaxID=3053457 RepID=A0AA43TLC9_9GAMM|nr:VWA domain-containing protein [Candidatus Methylobacter titanis]MDI1293472.1 VWA domain-containing protein [Candidatus Methylobacter titanis]